MAEPRVPGGSDALELPCGETVGVGEFDLGMREFECPCGDTHAVVMDVHPPDRFLPEFLVEALQEAVETTSEEMPEFGTPHVMGIVLEEFPEDAPGVPVRMPVHLRDAVGATICLIGLFDSLDESELTPCRHRYSPARVRRRWVPARVRQR